MTELVVAGLRATAPRAQPFLASARPAVSWRVETSARHWLQDSATIEVERDGIVRRHRHFGQQSAAVAWPDDDVRAYERLRIRVSVRGKDGSRSHPSEWLDLAAGPLVPTDWRAQFIGIRREPDRGVTRVRRELLIRPGLCEAVLTWTAHGITRMAVDGVPVDDGELHPGWTSYDDRLLHTSADLSRVLTPGRHVVSAAVADGWWGERYGFDGEFARTWEGARAVSAQLRLMYDDGTVEWIVTDHTWCAREDPATSFASLYQGEHHDSRTPCDGVRPGDPVGPEWEEARIIPVDRRVLRPMAHPPVRVIDRLRPVSSHRTSAGAMVYDLGQNIVGRVRIRTRAERGRELVIRHAEVLEHGELATRPLRSAAATDRYICAGDPDGEQWAPSFTYHGFRYVEISTTDLAPAEVEVEAEVLHTDLARTGWFECDHEGLNRLHSNAVWGFRGNILSLPTDCPQRDERLGWTGDIQIFAPAATYLYDSEAFLSNWLEDLSADQARQGGIVPLYVPLIRNSLFRVTQ